MMSDADVMWSVPQCQVGDRLVVRVGGDFWYSPHDPHNLLLVAGGLGINPLLSMLLHHSRLMGRGEEGEGEEEEEEEEEKQTRVRLLYSAKNVNELIFKVCHDLYFSTVTYD